MITDQYEKIIELWKAGEFSDAISYFSQWILEGSLSQNEIESFKKELARFWELVEVECEEKTEVMFSLYEMLKKARDWDDEALCKKLEFSEEVIEDVKNRHKPRSEGVGLKMLYELFPQMAL